MRGDRGCLAAVARAARRQEGVPLGPSTAQGGAVSGCEFLPPRGCGPAL